MGCGRVTHPEWVNIDLNHTNDNVLVHDIRTGLPFIPASVDVCYASHVIEHLERPAAKQLLLECHRVLKPGGIIRLVVPDLEGIAKIYLETLQNALVGKLNAEQNHEWMVIELIDQISRSYSGGEMIKYLQNATTKDREFIVSRIGEEAKNYWSGELQSNRRNIFSLFRGGRIRRMLQKMRSRCCEIAVFAIDGRRALYAFREGSFRQSGEVHRWMYDRFSLQNLLQSNGFIDIECRTATTSKISGYAKYQLDAADDITRKPDSLFVEALKP